MSDKDNQSIEASDGRCSDRRGEFLLEMYRQTSIHLGRHVSGVWQCVGVVVAAFIAFALDKDKPLNDYACALVILLCAWLAATTLDASNWFNRNLAIIANIERLFLEGRDLRLVHPFFDKHRKAGRQAEHFRIQMVLAVSVAILVLVFHYDARVAPELWRPICQIERSTALPYLTAIFSVVLCLYLRCHFVKKELMQQTEAPGLKMM